MSGKEKVVLILGANSDVAKASIKLYYEKGFRIFAASRSTTELQRFISENGLTDGRVEVLFFDAAAFETHAGFYQRLSPRPHVVIYAAGFQVTNDEALVNWAGTFQMMKVHYSGAVSILNIIAMDETNTHLERIVGLSSLSGVRGRKSNFIYGSTKAAFTQYLAGLRQHLSERGVKVNVIVSGYIRSKMTAHLKLPENLMLESEFVADKVVHAGNGFVIVPGLKWKLIYHILRLLPEYLVARLP
jgi:short-subunit dehydrogenase